MDGDIGRRAGVWGPWTTILWGALVLALSLAVQLLCAVVYVGAATRARSWLQILDAVGEVQFDGRFISVSLFASAALTAVLIAAIVAAKRGADLKDYLGLTLPSAPAALRWALAVAVFIAAYDVSTSVLGREVVPDFMSKSVASVGSPLPFFAALVVAAPVGEELLFRGFLLKGLAASRLGSYGGVALTAAAWAALHGQYGVYEIVSIFLVGIILGLCRLSTGSTLLTMALHAMANSVALVETIVHLRGGI